MTQIYKYRIVEQSIKDHLIPELTRIAMDYAMPNKQILKLHDDLIDWFVDIDDARYYRSHWIADGVFMVNLENHWAFDNYLPPNILFWHNSRLNNTPKEQVSNVCLFPLSQNNTPYTTLIKYNACVKELRTIFLYVKLC